MSGSAFAGELAAGLEVAKASITAGDFKAAKKQLDRVEDRAEELAAPASQRELATIPYLRGIAEHLAGDPKQRAMDYWRATLVIDSEYPWDTSLVADSATADLFLALGKEVRARQDVPTGVPPKTGEAKIFVDGVRMRSGESVKEGEHLGQVACPDGAVYGEWTDFRKPVRWLKMCPGGVDTSVVVADDEPEDEFGDMAPMFGPPPGGGGEGGDVTTTADAGTTTDAEGTADAGTTADANTPAGVPLNASGEPELIRRKIHWPLLAGAGGAAVVTGVVYATAMKNRRAFDDLENTELQSEQDIRDLAKKTNNQVVLSAGMLGVTAGLYVSAFIQW